MALACCRRTSRQKSGEKGRDFPEAGTPTAPLGNPLHSGAGGQPSLHGLLFPGYLAHSPTKAKAPAYTFQGAKPPATDSCSPGPCYYVQPSITRNGKYVAPAQHICGLPKIKTQVTPGPSEYPFSSPLLGQDNQPLPLPSAAAGPQSHQLAPWQSPRRCRVGNKPGAAPPSSAPCLSGPRRRAQLHCSAPLPLCPRRLLHRQGRQTPLQMPAGAVHGLPAQGQQNRPTTR